MKYYSELTKKVYDTEDELNTAEESYKKAKELAQKEKEEKVALRKEEANKVLDAYKESLAVRKECNEKITEADNKYFELRNEFIKKYGSWHMSYSNTDGNEEVSVADTLSFLGDFFNDLDYLFKLKF